LAWRVLRIILPVWSRPSKAVPTRTKALRKVRAFLDFDKGQAMAVLDMQVRRMSGTERARVRDELHQLRAEIEQLRSGR
jgi:DNA gyrase/topoisomerase IV subunit A